MSAGLSALCHQCICTGTLHTLCQSYRRHHRNHLDAGIFPRLHVLAGVAGTGSHDRHLFVNDQLCQIVGVGAHEHDVHTERVLRFFLADTNLFPQVINGSTAAGDQADCSGIGYRRCQCALCDPRHTALNHGVLAPQQFCNSGFHSYVPFYFRRCFLNIP